ncbi:peroxisomal-coenzyme a synthetase [Plasmodium falciparum IGH-CR14]|uniref:Peroxisomal-coenzyme a synthetase n=1 Tax=Plasmodium falciparum IGH-CR14 TaxID=580059 RepID=A0A0L1I6F8_PLAFA|nr:peroxisomal-coenzyme a synthetase [Plasmodium falciparum IGH-CR14]
MNQTNSLKSFLNIENVSDRFVTDLNTYKKQFSYNELYEEIEKFVNFFESINIKRGDEISIILFNSIEYVISFLSINFNHNICLPQNTNLKKEEYKRYLVNNCKYIIIHDYDENNEEYSSIKNKHSYYKNVCIYIKELAEEYGIGLIKIKKNKEKPYFTYSYINNGRKGELPNLNNDLKNEENNINKEEKNMLNSDICLHLHTSGTTSKVKIVQLSNTNIKTTITNITNSYNINRDDNTIIVMPLFHVHGLIGVLLPIIYCKGNILFQLGHSFSASEFWNNVENYNITYFSAIPTILKILIIRYEEDYLRKNKIKKNNDDDHDDDENNKCHKNPMNEKVKHKLRFIRTSSSSLDENLEKEIEEKFEVSVFQAYGMTEACHQVSSNKIIISSLSSPNNLQICKKFKSVGIPNVGVIIYNEEKKKICDYNELGEICINGKNVMCGYKELKDNDNIYIYANTVKERNEYMMKNPFLEIAEKVPFFKTGDIGYIDQDNFLFISGRIKDIINRGGEKIIPNEIDDVLRNHDLVQDCLTFSCKDDVYGEIINSAVILEENKILSSYNDDYNKNNTNNIYINKSSHEQKNMSLSPFDENLSIYLNLKYYMLKKELINYMKKYIADFKVPRNIYFVNNFLKTDTGKISRKKVSESIEELKKKQIKVFDNIIPLIFKKYDIKYIYGLYGIPINKIIYSFIKNNIYYISFRNEINASISCNYINYFDINNKEEKNKIGILFTCSGPAFINTLSGLYNAKVNNLPMVLICFENVRNEKLTLFEKYCNFQYFPQLDFLNKTKEICNQTYHVNNTLESFSTQFFNCIYTSLQHKAPTYLNIDYKLIEQTITLDKAIETLQLCDIYAQKCLNPNQFNKYTLLNNEQENLFTQLLNKFLQIYKNNQKCVIFMGINCNYGYKYIIKLAELLKIPIYTNTMAKSFVKENYLYNMNSCKSYLFNNLDSCICIGSVFNFYFNFGNFPNCQKKNMLCIDLINNAYDHDDQHHNNNNNNDNNNNNNKGDTLDVSHYFFSDLFHILKKLYYSVKNVIHIDDIENKKEWVNILNEMKKTNFNKMCIQINKYFEEEQFTMEQAMLIIRHILIDYYFLKNDIDEENKKHFLNYLKHVDKIKIRDFTNMQNVQYNDLMDKELDIPDVDEDILSDHNNDHNNDHNSGHNNNNDTHIHQYQDYSYNVYEKKDIIPKRKKKELYFLKKQIKNRIIITNEGSITLNLGILYLPKFGPYSYVIPQINGMMGVSMNASISAALDNPNNIIFSILGDSSFGFTSNEIETICRLKLKIVFIIFNNNGIYGNRDIPREQNETNTCIKEKHQTNNPSYYLNNPSTLYFFSKYENYVIAHGGYGCYIDNRKDFIKQMKYVTSQDFDHYPALLNVIIEDSGFVNFDVDKFVK